jgi:hypothetical protein
MKYLILKKFELFIKILFAAQNLRKKILHEFWSNI